MSSEVAVRFCSVTKRYRVRSGRAAVLDLVRPSSLRHRNALDDVSFDVAAGERLGLIGDNGAGKTTALRMITRIARPSEGSVTVNGSVGALLEVGSGISPDMTGRENIWLYGNILGLTKRQVADRFDKIVDFAELEDALDQQVKYYSSGMQLRLGFAIASRLDPDILIVDEALAVGDVRFQRKCFDHMGALARAGTTIIYVSHDLRSVEALCDRVIWLESGQIRADGHMTEVLASYLQASSSPGIDPVVTDHHHDVLKIESIELFDDGGEPTTSVVSGAGLEVRLVFNGPALDGPQVAIGLSSGGIQPFLVCSMAEHGTAPAHVEGRWSCTLKAQSLPLRRGRIEVWAGVLAADTLSELLTYRRVASLRVDGPVGQGRRAATEVGPVVASHRFHVELLT